MKLRKTLAMGLAAVCLLGMVSTVSAADRKVTSVYPGQLQSISFDPANDVHMYGSALCTTASVGHLTQWSGKMWGSMALAYTAGQCSFGYNGETENAMGKTKFVAPGSVLNSFSKEAHILNFYDKATTVLYY